ncbi:GNAT family N-acetyltransferase [Streptomyces sp. NPDC058084]|uniref:GNAT family N-acetyltransferase n=1 Tax=Streptomyces sp. NPDC058084 TaxID=3346333 RepID=UPI0036ECACD5
MRSQALGKLPRRARGRSAPCFGGAAFLARRVERWETGEEFTYAVALDGILSGACRLHRREDIPCDAYEIGYWVRPAATGRGVATRAARHPGPFSARRGRGRRPRAPRRRRGEGWGAGGGAVGCGASWRGVAWRSWHIRGCGPRRCRSRWWPRCSGRRRRPRCS